MFSAYYNMANFPADRLEGSFPFGCFLHSHILRHQLGSDSKGTEPPTESALWHPAFSLESLLSLSCGHLM